MQAVGVSLGSRWTDIDSILAVARRADELGYDSIWIGEAWGMDAFAVLTAIACNTGRIRLGTGITTVFSRTPSLLAQAVATLDIISKGRAVLGLGTSGRAVIEGWHGLKYDRPLERTREYINIIRMALKGQRVNHQGRFFKVAGFRLLSSPVQERVPIFVAAIGPKNLALTGGLADGWLPIWVHVGRLAGMKKRVEEGAVAAGRSIKEISVAPQILAYVTRSDEDRAEARRLLSSHMAYYVGGMGPYYQDLFKGYGYVEETRLVAEAWANKDRERAASLITDDMLENITAFGDEDECREKLQEYITEGADMPVISLPHGCPMEGIMHTLEALAPGD